MILLIINFKVAYRVRESNCPPYYSVVRGDSYSHAPYFYDFSKGKTDILHFVPWYDVGTIKDLSSVIEESFRDYMEDERDLKKEIDNTRSQLMILDTQFSIIESKQNYYFEVEKKELDFVMTSDMDARNFSIDHRYTFICIYVN